MRLRWIIIVASIVAMLACSSRPVARRPATAPSHSGGFEIVPGHAGATEQERIAPLAPGSFPAYQPVSGLSGKIVSVGSPTATNLVARAAAEFRRIYPGVTVQITASLASIGPTALTEGRADLVPMGRPLTPGEIQAFTARYHYAPTQIKVAADALAIYVEKRNPIHGLTLEQLDGIFSATHRRGGRSIETWGQRGLTGKWADRPIKLYGYGPWNGAHQIFREQVLRGGAFRLSLQVEGGGSAIVQDVASDPEAIGFASIFFAAKRVRALPLAGADGHFYGPTSQNVRSRRYPLTRFLYIDINKPPGQSLSGPVAAFLRFLLSRDGQQVVVDGGNLPLDAATAAQGRRAME